MSEQVNLNQILGLFINLNSFPRIASGQRIESGVLAFVSDLIQLGKTLVD